VSRISQVGRSAGGSCATVPFVVTGHDCAAGIHDGPHLSGGSDRLWVVPRVDKGSEKFSVGNTLMRRSANR
jgi:hypothetical protein